MKDNNSAKEISELIGNGDKILVLTHVNPDGDCLGSASALYSFIKNEYGKEAVLCVISKVPQLYEFLPNVDKFKKPEDILNETFDTVIAIQMDKEQMLLHLLLQLIVLQKTVWRLQFRSLTRQRSK